MLKLIKEYLKLSIFARKSFKKEIKRLDKIIEQLYEIKKEHEKLIEMEKEYENR